MKVLGGRRSMLPRKQGPVSDATQTKACLQDPKLARHSVGHCELPFFLVLFTVIT